MQKVSHHQHLNHPLKSSWGNIPSSEKVEIRKSVEVQNDTQNRSEERRVGKECRL